MNYITNRLYTIACLMLCICVASAQSISGKIEDTRGAPISGASIKLLRTNIGTSSNEDGAFRLGSVARGQWRLQIQAIGYRTVERSVKVETGDTPLVIVLEEDAASLDEVVVSGTLKEVSKLNSPIPVEVYSAKFFRANPNPTIFESLQNINGVRPQINCSVCNTGDIHINGLEGPYTMVLIDGMPIVSGLSTVYGLNGIPQALIERVEIVKGPASTLYGSEAVGGLINIITKNPGNAPKFSAEAFGTTWQEYNIDLGGKFRLGTAQSLIGVNYFNYSNPLDKNNDNFTDVTLQDRLSLFNKWSFSRRDNKVFTLAGRYVYEDRWGGEMNWNRRYRGGNEVYGESIYTKRWELMGIYDLPGREDLSLMFSVNGHDQNSVYGDTEYLADQKIAFGQLTWHKTLGRHDLLTGLAYRYTYYNDNTPATNTASNTHLPGLFVQDEVTLHPQHKLLLGARYDYNSVHGSIVSPRINYKWNSQDETHVLRIGIGNGYRVANVFTEDHAALTGARDVIFEEDLKPETSWNANVNYVKKFYSESGSVFGIDASAFYTYFLNKIIPDYETNVQQIIYSNLDGHAVSQGISLNLDWAHSSGFKAMIGGTFLDVYSEEKGVREWQMLTEKFMGTWTIGYNFRRAGLSIDYTGNMIGPMRLPVLGETDPRPDKSSTWSIQNIQVTKHFNNGLEIFGGVKNLLNWLPTRGIPFLISRSHDPFDRELGSFDLETGEPIVSPTNPYGLTFDPSYVYGPNQGIRGFLGLRYNLFN